MTDDHSDHSAEGAGKQSAGGAQEKNESTASDEETDEEAVELEEHSDHSAEGAGVDKREEKVAGENKENKEAVEEETEEEEAELDDEEEAEERRKQKRVKELLRPPKPEPSRR